MSLLYRNIFNKLGRCVNITSRFCTVVENQCLEREKFEPRISVTEAIESGKFFHNPRQVWIESLKTIPGKKFGIAHLHPDVFAAQPRVDIIHENIRWQRMFRFVSYAHTKTRAEVKGGGRKPWPQKGQGKARHGSIRSPLWRKGGVVHGPRSPTTHFYMLPFYKRVYGLTSTLTVKLAQDDLHIVTDLEIPSEETSYVEDIINERNWGPSVLFVDDMDFMPRNISIATETIKHVNLMPVYGLNVYSMLKHDTLVLTERAARLIEEKLLYQLNRADERKVNSKFKLNQ
ncbi:39S ribosomal protein L4, mitochondrial [Leptopilina boulardi]|uniref:39S ribosomal protein L4, mitochondrial n=1 Tax=Leptopilina boulardi TaxID=63433 RepID=UPI0021F573A2|nr:39S ribosomal protein L4, mitochondrial [Leptopilina boulardi]